MTFKIKFEGNENVLQRDVSVRKKNSLQKKRLILFQFLILEEI
jgi:hypothetical protein